MDGAEVNVADKVAFKGMMLDGVPNFAFTIGYTNSAGRRRGIHALSPAGAMNGP